MGGDRDDGRLGVERLAAYRLVALMPSMIGIWISMKMMSNGWLWASLTASLPFLHTTTWLTISLSMAAMSLRLAALSSTASTLISCTLRGRGRQRSAAHRLGREQGVQQLAMVDGFGEAVLGTVGQHGLVERRLVAA